MTYPVFGILFKVYGFEQSTSEVLMCHDKDCPMECTVALSDTSILDEVKSSAIFFYTLIRSL